MCLRQPNAVILATGLLDGEDRIVASHNGDPGTRSPVFSRRGAVRARELEPPSGGGRPGPWALRPRGDIILPADSDTRATSLGVEKPRRRWSDSPASLPIRLTQQGPICWGGAREPEDAPSRLPEDPCRVQVRFATEDACRRYLMESRWPNGYRCPRCPRHADAYPVAGRGLLAVQRVSLPGLGHGGDGDASYARALARLVLGCLPGDHAYAGVLGVAAPAAAPVWDGTRPRGPCCRNSVARCSVPSATTSPAPSKWMRPMSAA